MTKLTPLRFLELIPSFGNSGLSVLSSNTQSKLGMNDGKGTKAFGPMVE